MDETTDQAEGEGERPCRVCGHGKPPSSFVSGSAGRVRRHRVCRECRSRADRAYRDAHPEQRERFNQWRRALHRRATGDHQRPPGPATGEEDGHG